MHVGPPVLFQVNAALEELVSHAAACYKQMVLVSRNQLNRVAAEERQRLHDLYHAVEVGRHCAGRGCHTQCSGAFMQNVGRVVSSHPAQLMATAACYSVTVLSGHHSAVPAPHCDFCNVTWQAVA